MRKFNNTPAGSTPAMPDYAPGLDSTETPKAKRRLFTPKLMAGLAVGGLLGGMIGAASAGGGDAPAPTATSTETVTAEAKPAPTVTATAPAEQVTTEVTPESCLVALDAAEGVIGAGSTIAGYAGELGPMVAEAAIAGAYGDAATLDAITIRMQEINAEMGPVNEALETDVAEYLETAQDCRAGAE